jgi:hypothetical protein
MVFFPRYSNAAGVEYGGDVSFYFSRCSDITFKTIYFGLSNGTDTYYYTISKNSTAEINATLQGGKAYLLPALDSGKWVR